MNIKQQLECIVDTQLENQLQSIKEQGLIPLKKITNKSLALSTLQVQGINDNICVNYLNLKDSSLIAKNIELALFDQYYGIFGILLNVLYIALIIWGHATGFSSIHAVASSITALAAI